MRIIETYSHLNGLEFLLVHKPDLWKEVATVVTAVDAESCKNKVSKEKRTKGNLLYSPIEMNAWFKKLLQQKGWGESRVSYWVTRSEKLIRKTLGLSATEQKQEIEQAGEKPISSKIVLPSRSSSGSTRSLPMIYSSSTSRFTLVTT